jgi:Uma2 family endonuclease
MAETNAGAVAQAELPPPVPPFEMEPEAMFMLLTEDDLPSEDGMPMETERHRKQMYLLLDVLELYWAERENWYASGNMFLYFSPRQIKTERYRGLDFFAVLGVERRERKSYVVWQEGKIPDLIIELLSDTTREFDKTEKKRIYQDELRVPEYFWFDPHTHEWAGFELRDWHYEPIEPDEQGRLISKQLGLALSLREGWFQNYGGTWLRWETLDGELLPSAEEMARAAQREAEAARHEKQVSEQRATELEAMLAKYQAQFGKLPE